MYSKPATSIALGVPDSVGDPTCPQGGRQAHLKIDCRFFPHQRPRLGAGLATSSSEQEHVMDIAGLCRQVTSGKMRITGLVAGGLGLAMTLAAAAPPGPRESITNRV